MTSQRDNLDLDAWWHHLSRLPWWLWTLGALASALGLHWLAGVGHGPGAADGWYLVWILAGLGQWLIPAALLLAAGTSGYRSWQGRQAHLALTAYPRKLALADLGWESFGLLVAEVYRGRGYRVGEPVRAGTQGGSVLLLDGAEGHTLVLCRHWQTWRVGAAEVQELIAAMGARGIGRGALVIPGDFTRDALRMAQGRAIELIDGAGLQALLRDVASMPAPVAPTRRRRPFRMPRMHLPLRPVLHLAGTLAVAGALYAGFQRVLSLPDKRLLPEVPTPVQVADPGPKILVPEPAQVRAPAPVPPPPPGLGGFRSVQEAEAAFDAFYVAPPGCASPANRTDMVNCTNHRIRARQGFMVAGTPVEPEPAMESAPEPAPESTPASGYATDPIPTDDPAWDDPATIDALAPPGSPGHRPDDEDPGATADQGPAPPPRTQARVSAPGARDPASTYAPYDPRAPWPGR